MSWIVATGTSPPALRPLATEPLAPQRLSARGQAFTAIKNVESIRVVRNPDRTADCKYIVQVFSLESQSRIPANSVRLSAPPSSSKAVPTARPASKAVLDSKRPTSTVFKTFDDFLNLRDDLYTVAHDAHSTKMCEVCRTIIDYTLWSYLPPNGIARAFMSDEKLSRTLTKFLVDLLPLIESGCSPTADRRLCSGRAGAPIVLHDFLFEPSA